MSSIYREPAVLRRISQRSSLKKITSNSTIAAAVMVLAALIARQLPTLLLMKWFEKFLKSK